MLVQLNAKGQLTVPQEVRRKLGLRPGDVLELEARGEVLVLRPCSSGEPVVRTVSPSVLNSLKGITRLGGDALEDTEELYDGQ
ncbi:AbrB/MazE/SpoVT family DNA-binding domain-containing protein [bacterium CPR1]|nr:AbrB/MazE/SpoVT family DNA-binding domain-containing protein [bacterium CPR1]